MRVHYIKNKVILQWFGDELYKEMAKLTAKDEKESAERIHKLVLKNAPIGSYRRRFKKTYRSFSLDSKGNRKVVAMKPWQQRMPGRLKESIVKLKSKYEGGGWIVMAGNYLAYYARIVEYGTKERRQKTTGRFTGRQKKSSKYMRKALNNEKARFIRSVRTSLQNLRGMNI